MPNTLAHLGVQALCSKAVFHKADFKWIAVGCVIPDLPWIMQRLAIQLVPGINPLDLRIYTMIQASLFFTLLLSAAISLPVKNGGRVFLLLSLNCLLHLLLDAMQIKWGSGVHLLAPFSWQLTGFNLFWPEHIVWYGLTLFGLAVLVFFSWQDWSYPVIFPGNRMRFGAGILFLVLYLLLPLTLFNGPVHADNHFVATLQQKDSRSGKAIAIDRLKYREKDHTIQIFSGEILAVQGALPKQNGRVSLKGHFIDQNTILISSSHVHGHTRDISSIIALAGILLLWLVALLKKRITIGH